MGNEQQELIEKIEALLQKKFSATDEDSMKKLFLAYDANNDGKIDKDELMKLLKDADVGNTFTRGAWVKGVLEQLDRNADKAISWDEFKAATKS